MRSEAGQYRAETAQLRHELRPAARRRKQPRRIRPSASTPAQPASLGRTSGLARGIIPTADQQNRRSVSDQGRRASKYRVRLSGIVLLNLFSNHGVVDNQDVPTLGDSPDSERAGGEFGATLRQSEIGLEVFGPHVLGARTSATCNWIFQAGPRILQRRQLWYGPAAYGQHADGLEHYLDRSRAGQLVLLAAFAHLLCFTCRAGIQLRREPLGMDSASAGRTSLRYFRRPEHYHAGRNTRQPDQRAPSASLSSPRPERVQAAGLCNPVAWTATFLAALDAGRGRLLQPPGLGHRPLRGRLGRHDGLECSAGLG